jgi:glucose-1-phosphate thymidylyltransferase
MAGGKGSRLAPLTNVVNKHLLPIFDKPMIYYPLTTLMLAGIREFALITAPKDILHFRKLFSNGDKFGIKITYIEQDNPLGIGEGISLSRNFAGKEKVALILGDNVFHGIGLGRQLAMYTDVIGAQIFAYQVRDPENYGVVEISPTGEILSLQEKPTNPKSKFAIPGLYFYDNEVFNFAENLHPSKRGEFEVTDLNKQYLAKNKLNVSILSAGTSWLDTGTFNGLHDAASFIRIMEERQNSIIGDPTHAARIQGWIR